MAIVTGNNLQNFRLVILVSQWQDFTSIVAGNGLQIVDRCGLVLLWVRSALSPSFSLFGNAGLWSKGFMLAISTAGIYSQIQLMYTASLTPGQICYKVYWLATIDPCIADSPKNLLSCSKRLSLWHLPRRWYYPSHIGKCTGSLFCIEEELFFIVKEGLNHTWWWG